MKKLVFLLIILMFSLKISAQEEYTTVIEPRAYKEEILGNEVQLVDVRTPEEFAEGHIEGAVNIDFLADGFLEQFEQLKKDRPIYIYCRSGNRSSKAAAILSDKGFRSIIDLKGGFKGWIAEDEKE